MPSNISNCPFRAELEINTYRVREVIVFLQTKKDKEVSIIYLLMLDTCGGKRKGHKLFNIEQ